ncbi:hypothetical protein B0H13DRAFT_1867218 [Mycena leptocephala]|nr:hypothetical protein B0H13DRAFT_1867218 [Mycena leptocephala]
MPKAGYKQRSTSKKSRSQKEPSQCSFCGGPLPPTSSMRESAMNTAISAGCIPPFIEQRRHPAELQVYVALDQERAPNAQIDEDLLDLRDRSLTTDSLVIFRNHCDMEKALAAARVSNVPFRCTTLTIEFEGIHFGGTYNVEVEFCDPWSIITQWVCDPTLAPVSTWFSQEKYLCLNGTIDLLNPLYDEPFTGETWRRVDDDLPGDGYYPSCFLGLHVWLDKELVSTKVKMHPILLRGCWINSATRNGSGNGGSALVGFVKMIDPRNLNTAAREEYNRLKRLIYRGSARRSWPHCSIGLIAARLCASEMNGNQDVYCSCEGPNLVENPVKQVPKRHFLWSFAYSDPYEATGYDCLHFFDGGIWGQHMWVLLKEYLQTNGLATDFNSNTFPRQQQSIIRWSDIFGYSQGNHVADSSSILPPNSCLIKLVRVMQKEVSEEHDKSLNFLKKHFLSHAIKNFRGKGTSRNMNTCVGEGFQ